MNKPYTISAFCLMLICIPSLCFTQNTYELFFKPDRVIIEANFVKCGPELYMILGSTKDSEIGQQELVQNVQIIQADQSLQLDAVEPGKWQIPGIAKGEQKAVRFQYEVLLNFDQFDWNSGKEEMAYQVPNGHVFSMRSLFIWPLEKYDIDEPVQLEFHLPKGQQLFTPWNLGAPEKRTVTVPDFVAFLYNTFLIGNFELSRLSQDGLEMYVACLDTLQKHQNTFQQLIAQTTKYFTHTIGPKTGKYLVIYSPGERNDGGAFENSFSQTIYGAVNQASLPVWGGLSAHEISHLWHGRDITFAGAEEEWILEGWADYLTILALSQTKTISPKQVMDKLENSIRKYRIGKFRLSPNTSLTEAGHRKGEHRMLLYGGGAMAAMYFDWQIRKHTQGKKSLSDLLQQLYQEKEKGAFSTKQIEEQITQMCQYDFSSFFDKCIRGKELLPIEAILKELSFQLDVFGYEDVHLTIVNKNKMRKEMFGF